MLLAVACHTCLATELAAQWETGQVAAIHAFEVERLPFGSGTPAEDVTTGTESAHAVVDGLYHVPNYMPGYPTAATIWPRELPVECDSDSAGSAPRCTGYRVLPVVGRGEYIFVRPYAKPLPQVIETPPPPPPPEKPIPVTHKKPLE